MTDLTRERVKPGSVMDCFLALVTAAKVEADDAITQHWVSQVRQAILEREKLLECIKDLDKGLATVFGFYEGHGRKSVMQAKHADTIALARESGGK